ncbi:MAG TPA: hypothetical protein PKO33_16180, partial [Pyrinomonadaceae bacterium]|nr:hypothetical protein [Pyrinomonadaceae bacterium]
MMRTLSKLFPLIIALASTATAFAQSVPPKATADPLATVWYLLSKSDPDQYESEKTCLAWSYFHVDRLPGIVAATSLVPPGTYHEEDFVAIAKRLVEKGRRREANEYVDLLLRRAQDNSEKQQLAGVLANLGREAEALALDPKEDGKPDAELYLTVADVIIKGPDPRRALRVLEAIEPSIVKSGEIRDRSMLALDFARLSEAEKAANLVKLALDEVVWKERDIEMDIDQRVALDDVTAALLRLGRFDEAESIIARRGFGEEGRWLLMVARAHYELNEVVKGDELVDRLLKLSDPADYGDSFHLGDLVDDLLLRGRADRALTLAKSLSGSEYMRQMKLLKIADLFIRDKNFIGAADALDFAYAETSKIDVSEPESGS